MELIKLEHLFCGLKKSNAYKLNLHNFVYLRSNILNIWWIWYDKYVDVFPS